MIDAVDIHVKGIVQGVGFRPFVYRMAKKYLINGWVLNATDGVHIHAEGESALVDEFIMELSDNAPAASKVEEIDIKEVPLEDFDSFEIRFSDDEDVAEDHTCVARACHLRRLRSRAVQSERPSLPLPVCQLHELRATLHHY